ncbi:MAG: hypothetical protein HOQ22_12580 [Nocardioidaceae bacterium]|nr:hypothetical protein [Nocardioidaceae bacterium]NUS51857.1 hypothetical protein [Nocardioidaceae bacterium]
MVVVALAAVLILGVGWWHRAAVRTAEAVSARWTLDCTDTKVRGGSRTLVVESRPGFRCQVDLRVVNASDRSIRVQHVGAPVLGSGGGGEIRGYSTTDATVHETSDGDDVDAVYEVGLTVPAHAARTVRLAVGWRASGCNSAGHMGFPRWPTLAFDTMHRSFRYLPDQKLVLRTYDDAHEDKACAG